MCDRRPARRRRRARGQYFANAEVASRWLDSKTARVESDCAPLSRPSQTWRASTTGLNSNVDGWRRGRPERRGRGTAREKLYRTLPWAPNKLPNVGGGSGLGASAVPSVGRPLSPVVGHELPRRELACGGCKHRPKPPARLVAGGTCLQACSASESEEFANGWRQTLHRSADKAGEDRSDTLCYILGVRRLQRRFSSRDISCTS